MLYTKTILKWGLELHLNFRAKILKLLEENIRVNLHDLGLGKAFLDTTPQAQTTKENNR